jgi:hypothetical protein
MLGADSVFLPVFRANARMPGPRHALPSVSASDAFHMTTGRELARARTWLRIAAVITTLCIFGIGMVMLAGLFSGEKNPSPYFVLGPVMAFTVIYGLMPPLVRDARSGWASLVSPLFLAGGVYYSAPFLWNSLEYFQEQTWDWKIVLGFLLMTAWGFTRRLMRVYSLNDDGVRDLIGEWRIGPKDVGRRILRGA